MKKKILFILNEFPGAFSPTSIAADAVIREMTKENEVFCLARRRYGQPAQETAEGATVFRVSDSVVSRFSGYAKERGGKGLNLIAAFCKAARFRLSQILTAPLYPRFAPFFERRLKREALRICREYAIDLIVSVCFPGESVAAGHYVRKKMPRILFVPYMIDAYACGTPPKYLPRKFSAGRRHAYERKLTRNADRIIAMEASRSFHEQKDAGDDRFVYLNPAFLAPPPPADGDTAGILEKGKINVLFTGYLYLPDRDPRYVIRALDREDVCLIFVGKDAVGDLWEKETGSFRGTLKHIGFMPHRELAALLRGADILLNMGVSNSSAISGKIFEYMAFGKPILTTYFKPDDAALPYLGKYPLACSIDQTATDGKEAAERIDGFIREIKGRSVPFETVRELFYNSTPEAFAEEIRTLWQGERE